MTTKIDSDRSEPPPWASVVVALPDRNYCEFRVGELLVANSYERKQLIALAWAIDDAAAAPAREQAAAAERLADERLAELRGLTGAIDAARAEGCREGRALGYHGAAGYVESFLAPDARVLRQRSDLLQMLVKDLRDLARDDEFAPTPSKAAPAEPSGCDGGLDHVCGPGCDPEPPAGGAKTFEVPRDDRAPKRPDIDPLTAPLEQVEAYLRAEGFDPEAIHRKGDAIGRVLRGETPDDRERAIVRRLAGEWGEIEVGPTNSIDDVVSHIHGAGTVIMRLINEVGDWSYWARRILGSKEHRDAKLREAIDAKLAAGGDAAALAFVRERVEALRTSAAGWHSDAMDALDRVLSFFDGSDDVVDHGSDEDEE